MTTSEMIEQVKKYPGWTFPAWKITPEQIEKIRADTGTIVEYDKGGSPRFMPADEKSAQAIRDMWTRYGLDVKDYGPKAATA